MHKILFGRLEMNGLLHHIEIYVSDLKRSKEFWGWLLSLMGYKEYQKWDRGISYILGSTYIVFVQTEEKHLDATYHRCKTGLNHLAFWGESNQFVDRITNLLRERNVKILYEERHPHAGGNNSYAVFFEDPDRIKVEIVAEE
jgi:catechol 2,3-dioxygenase-like lactoylglutathione lyase family enzyme